MFGGVEVQIGKDTEPPLVFCVPSSIRKKQAPFCETLGLKEDGKPWTRGGQPGLGAR